MALNDSVEETSSSLGMVFEGFCSGAQKDSVERYCVVSQTVYLKFSAVRCRKILWKDIALFRRQVI